MRYRRYLKSNHQVLYYNFLTSGKLNDYLTDIEQIVKSLFKQTVKLLAEQEQVKKIKAENMILWIQKMNNIRNRATEFVNAQVIYK